MSAEVRAALRGNLATLIERDVRAVDRGTTTAIKDSTRALQLAAREEINRRFRGSGRVKGGNRRIANAIRSRIFDDGPFDTAGLVYSKFGRKSRGQFLDYLAPHVLGATLRPLNSQWLYIPIGGGRSGRQRRLSLGDDKRLAFVSIGPGRALLVRRQRGSSKIVALLVKRVRIKPSLNFARLVAAEEARLPKRLLDAMNKAAA